jgi:hypothetical protein
MYILFMYVRITINRYLASPQQHTQNMLSHHIIHTHKVCYHLILFTHTHTHTQHAITSYHPHTHTACYHLMLSTLNARFPTNNVAPSGALHPFGDFPLYGNASMGTLSPKGTRVNLSALVMIAPSLHGKWEIHRNFGYFMFYVCCYMLYIYYCMYNLCDYMFC